MTSLIDGIRRNDFVVVGRAGMDLVPTESGRAIEDGGSYTADLGGSSANIAVGIVRLGGAASIVTRVSDDAIGRFCLNSLDRYGIGHRYVRAAGGQARSSLALYDMGVADQKTVIYRNEASDFQMTVEDVDAVDFAAHGALILTGTAFAMDPSRNAAFHAIDKARAAGVPALLDVDYRPYSWVSDAEASAVMMRAARACQAVIGNDEEFHLMAGSAGSGLDFARKLAEAGSELVVYKMGADGSVAFAGGEELRTGIFPAHPLKPNGAGDSFLAGLLASLADGLAVREAVVRGSAAAAMVVSRPGCASAMPDRLELEDFLASNPRPHAA